MLLNKNLQESDMEYLSFGKTGKTVSRLGFGGAAAGLRNYLHEYEPESVENIEKAVDAIKRALELGVTYFDTAPGYGSGASERIFGKALEEADPEKIFLATKAPFGSRDDTWRSFEQSLKNLKRDYVDLIQIHGDSIDIEKEEIIAKRGGMLEALKEIKAQGLAKNIGFTTEDSNDAVYRLIRSGEFDTIQICYNFIFQHPYEPSRPFGTLYEAEKAGLGIAVMRAPTSGTFQRWIQMVNPENTFDYTPALIQFVLSNPLVDVALVGMRTRERVEANVAIANDLSGRIDISAVHTRYV
jgi:predicted aldo/keto reductase-like oxidoreductase